LIFQAASCSENSMIACSAPLISISRWVPRISSQS
jgi:hypothetical protein